MRRGSASTLQDVAESAGVSCMVASVVLNGARSTTRVSDATRERIVEAGKRLKYRRNAAAVGLSRRKMNTIGVVATIDGGEMNLYILELLNGILEGAADHLQNTTIFSVKNWKHEEHRLLEFCDGRIDGLILIAPNLSEEVSSHLPHRVPLVTIHSNCEIPFAHNLDVDNEGGAYAAVNYLIELGHRRILHISGERSVEGAQRRTQGYRRALSDAGIAVDPAYVADGEFSAYAGRSAMSDWLRNNLPLPTAVFCASDAIASGCLDVLQDMGIKVPEEISVCGFDDTLTARMTSPLLTTVRQPFREMGRRAAALLVEQIQHDAKMAASTTASYSESPHSPMKTEQFPTEVIKRYSVAPPRAL